MWDFFKEHYLNVISLIIIAFLLLRLYTTGKRETVKKIILSLVIQAEKSLGSGTGELKYAMVVERAYSLLPLSVRLFITREQLDNLIEEAVRYMKRQLQSGTSLLGYDDEYKLTQDIDLSLLGSAKGGESSDK